MTHKVNCQDCFRCVRSCPVKAIGIRKGHAHIIEERCILCGRCVVECPQKAKQVDNQIQRLQTALEKGQRVVISLAPSYVAAFPEIAREELIQALTGAGIHSVAETAVAATMISEIYGTYMQPSSQGLPDATVISSCCPVIINIIERYYPQLIDNLTPVISPMLAHAKLIKKQYGQDTFVVFAGPCIAKIGEGSGANSMVDAVITFEELKNWLSSPFKNPTIMQAGAREQSSLASMSAGRCFPVAGGIVMPFVGLTDAEIITVDGIEKCMEVFEGLINQEFSPRFVEALACSGGCIGGPAMGIRQFMQTKRNKVLAYTQAGCTDKCHYAADNTLDLSRSYQSKTINAVIPTEEEITEILKQTGKFTVQDEKNCSACGYDTCRAKAIAVFQGHAELDMCVPYMRSKAESFANIIVENSLNAIIAVNEKMIIKEFNPAVTRMFGKIKEIYKGMNLTELFNCSDFIAAAKFGHKIVGKRVEYPLYDIVTEQMIIPVPEHGLIIAIITDITAHELRNRELQQMKLETVEKATDIINKQMHVAQEIAGLLGETTAETKSALLELIMLIKGKGES
ncbi:[Fe-Fe] hydrogenase large subunit C-terminal domain-containing protein [Sporomusa paucivorans]|uniref:[Fe-Fe] hydrogenase large subunit C-terminal domain-containing protein n=1 Tax=Sporomusa TaxID=2375 RepID=UPI00357117C9